MSIEFDYTGKKHFKFFVFSSFGFFTFTLENDKNIYVTKISTNENHDQKVKDTWNYCQIYGKFNLHALLQMRIHYSIHTSGLS